MRICVLLGIGMNITTLLFWPTLCWPGLNPDTNSLPSTLYPDNNRLTLGVRRAPLDGFQLLDPSRLHISQSYSLSFSSDGKDSQMAGLYLNTISYHFSIPFSMKLKVGYLHDPSSLFNVSKGSADKEHLFIPEVEMTYRPTQNLMFQFEYKVLPSYSLMRSQYRPTFDAEWY